MESKAVRFRSFDGVSLEGTLTLPDGPCHSGVVQVHGIDSDRDEYGFYSRMSDFLGDNGFASFRFDWRCYGVDKERALNELTLAGIFNDIEAAIVRFREVSNVSKIALVAASFGGGVTTNWVLRNLKHPVSSLILLAPVLDYAYDYLALEGLGDQAGVSEKAARELESRGVLKTSGRDFSRSLISEFPHFSARPAPNLPILLMHGTADTGVPFENSKAYAEEIPHVTFVPMDGAEHGFAVPGDAELEWDGTLENHQVVYKRIVEWLRGQTDVPC